MSKVSRALSRAVTAVVCSAALVFITCVAMGTVALAAGTTVALPGVFSATAGTANGGLALGFVPNATGLVVGILVLAAAGSAVGYRRARSSQAPSRGEQGRIG